MYTNLEIVLHTFATIPVTTVLDWSDHLISSNLWKIPQFKEIRRKA